MKKIFKNLMLCVCVLSLGLFGLVGCGSDANKNKTQSPSDIELTGTQILSVLTDFEEQVAGGETGSNFKAVDLLAPRVYNVTDKNFSSYGIPDSCFEAIIDNDEYAENTRGLFADGVAAQIWGEGEEFDGIRGYSRRFTKATNVGKLIGQVYSYGIDGVNKICIAGATKEKITLYLSSSDGYAQYELYCNKTLDGISRITASMSYVQRQDKEYLDIHFDSFGKITTYFACTFSTELSDSNAYVSSVGEVNFVLGHALKENVQDNSLKSRTLYMKCFANEDISTIRSKIISTVTTDNIIALEY